MMSYRMPSGSGQSHDQSPHPGRVAECLTGHRPAREPEEPGRRRHASSPRRIRHLHEMAAGLSFAEPGE
ncbi:hypothetical protein OV320_1297 [Actinobacteria bacterium OV320]|nr:hypothetical protein OV320_1297 [Actinobacteria bacterium OV320]